MGMMTYSFYQSNQLRTEPDTFAWRFQWTYCQGYITYFLQEPHSYTSEPHSNTSAPKLKSPLISLQIIPKEWTYHNTQILQKRRLLKLIDLPIYHLSYVLLIIFFWTIRKTRLEIIFLSKEKLFYCRKRLFGYKVQLKLYHCKDLNNNVDRKNLELHRSQQTDV